MDESGEKEMKMKLVSQKKCERKRKEREEVVASCKTSKRLFPRDDEPDMKLKMLLLSLKNHLLSEYGYPCEVGRTIVNGYDTKLLQDVVETALTNFASPSENKEEAVVASSKTSKLLPKKKMKLVSPKKKSDFHSEYAVPGCGEVGRISITGYDIELPLEDVETALRNHFSQCGTITDLYVPPYGNVSYVYFIGKGAVEKALKLNGTDVGGWTVNIKPFPFLPDAKRILWLTVEGFDTSGSKTEIENALIDHFSSCGEVDNVYVNDGDAELYVTGEDVAEKVPKLNGSSFMGHHKLVLHHVCYPKIRTIHQRWVPKRI